MSSRIAKRRAAALAEGNPAYAERRRAIIATAAQVFRDKGFQRASLADVAEAVGADRASLYYYIGSKEEAFQEIVRAAALANAEQAEKIRSGEGKAPEKVRQLITSLITSYAEHPYLFVYIQEDLSQFSDPRSEWAHEMRAIYKRYDDAVVGIIQGGLDDGSIRPVGTARLLANAVIGMVNWSHRWYHPGSKAAPAPKEIAGTFADAILGGLQTRRSPAKPRSAKSDSSTRTTRARG